MNIGFSPISLQLNPHFRKKEEQERPTHTTTGLGSQQNMDARTYAEAVKQAATQKPDSVEIKK